MTPSNRLSRVIAIGDPGPTQQQITTALSSQHEFELVEVLTAPERMVREISAARADIILIDHELVSQPTVDIIDDLTAEFPNAAIVAILPDNDPQQIQRVIMAGARGFVVQPFTQINLLSTLRRVGELEKRRRREYRVEQPDLTESSRPLQTVAVYSPRGGAGSTTLAINVALAYQEETGQKVLLLEGKQFFGHVDVMLNIRSHNSLADLIPHASSLDESIIQDVVVRHGTGLNVLLGFSNMQAAQGLRPDSLYSVLISLRRAFDVIVIDAGSLLNENTVTYLDAADRILLLTTPDLSSLRDASKFIQISQSLSYPPEKMLVTMNREGMPGGVGAKDIEVTLRQPLFARLPEATAEVQRSLNRGIPLILNYPRSPASRAIREMTKALTEMRAIDPVRIPVGKTLDKAQMEALLVSSQFG